jgi:N-acetyl-gamma-glutamyl-phosphate reductase
MKTKKFRIGLIGVTGYGGLETYQLIRQHPDLELSYIADLDIHVGKDIADIFPQVAHLAGKTVIEPVDPASLAKRADAVLLATPHDLAHKMAPAFLAEGCKMIDYSADFRIQDRERIKNAYGFTHSCPDILRESVYGLPELFRDRIKKARVIANPGCYPTTILLGLAPLSGKPWVKPETIISSSLSGATGAGRRNDYNFLLGEIGESVKPYNPFKHRHVDEIEPLLEGTLGFKQSLAFVPHLLPIRRGMLSSIYIRVDSALTLDEVTRAFQSRFQSEPFVRLRGPKVLPAISWVVPGNYCDIGWSLDSVRGILAVFSAIDNLGKGQSWQAMQNLNLILGLPETAGLIP